MTVFVCPKCGATDEQPLALRDWHRCGGKYRELRRVDTPPPPPEPEPMPQGRLF